MIGSLRGSLAEEKRELADEIKRLAAALESSEKADKANVEQVSPTRMARRITRRFILISITGEYSTAANYPDAERWDQYLGDDVIQSTRWFFKVGRLVCLLSIVD